MPNEGWAEFYGRDSGGQDPARKVVALACKSFSGIRIRQDKRDYWLWCERFLRLQVDVSVFRDILTTTSGARPTTSTQEPRPAFGSGGVLVFHGLTAAGGRLQFRRAAGGRGLAPVVLMGAIPEASKRVRAVGRSSGS